MRPFAYSRADTIDEMLAVSGDPGTAILAGGTELLNWLRLGVVAPDRVIDIARLGLDRIESLSGGGLRIGATAKLNDIAADARVQTDWPVLREAIHKAASAQLRNLATIGGNLLQKTRCAYFRSEDPVQCNRREPGSGCAALAGRSDRHALFGWTEDCVATHPADPAVALAALDAEVVLRSSDGERRVPAREFHVLPGERERTDVDSVLEHGELIEAIELPSPAPRSAYVKVRERESYEYALVSAAATVELTEGGAIGAARIALGSVALRPWRLDAAEERLAGLRLDDDGIVDAIDAALSDARPAPGSAYKVTLARNAARRALAAAAGAQT
jgi:xanthine dehydrogenase YagS FAD-binding subunit